MKKLIIGALVGAIILFLWQFLSFSLLGIHESQMSYTPKQDAVLEALAAAELEPGQYFVPRAPSGVSAAEMQALTEKYVGKPWAMITYNASYSDSMGTNLLRGFAIDFVSAFLLAWMLLKFAEAQLPDIRDGFDRRRADRVPDDQLPEQCLV